MCLVCETVGVIEVSEPVSFILGIYINIMEFTSLGLRLVLFLKGATHVFFRRVYYS